MHMLLVLLFGDAGAAAASSLAAAREFCLLLGMRAAAWRAGMLPLCLGEGSAPFLLLRGEDSADATAAPMWDVFSRDSMLGRLPLQLLLLLLRS